MADIVLFLCLEVERGKRRNGGRSSAELGVLGEERRARDEDDSGLLLPIVRAD